ncbi:CAAX prenyl protease-like protein [Shimia isoporae]|uniref:CAAX prenyl protease-like protein n=1 Tax=Shimia isoporae TaxID=647720 RepID=A0A4R1NKJ4_9RHOB|nr:CPBP family intramembrane glutamic endopeptidase [Shimia isoporae]TCL08837.1 CAAX prenyl protease-like protein [Shimia isoporae]
MGTQSTISQNYRWQLCVEFCLLFVAAPVLIATLLPATVMFTALFALTALGLGLLHITLGFRWHFLREGISEIKLGETLVFTALMFIACFGVMRIFASEAAFFLLRNEPLLLLMILIFYPIVSALPQELVFRPLFFRRYKAILPDGAASIWLNAALFSLAHLMYWSWIVAIMTFIGGLIFAHSYKERRSLPLAVLQHAIAGNIIFLVGLGVFFYSGNVVRPF